MTSTHLLNLIIHIAAGTLGIGLGLVILAQAKGTERHRRLGHWFLALCLVVGATATVGLILFRFIPLFAVLTLLTTYQLISGWRSARRKEAGPAAFDALWTLAGVAITALMLPILLAAPSGGGSTPVVVTATLAALALILTYDSVRWLFPRRWFRHLWPFEHVYKLISSFAALVSALIGNVVVWGQPWSQVLPSFAGTALTLYFFWRLWRDPDTGSIDHGK